MPPLITAGLWDAQIEAIDNLEASLADDRPRALIQMATGSGKTFTTNGTHYHKRKIDRSPFNVDCMFVPKRGHLRLSRFEVGDPQTWLDYSDHVPLIADFDIDAGTALRPWWASVKRCLQGRRKSAVQRSRE